jgi:hypothetical protein
VYVITEVPTVTPVTTPVAASIVALALLLLHVPPAGNELSEVVRPAQTPVLPVIPPGRELTVTIVEVEQPVGIV